MYFYFYSGLECGAATITLCPFGFSNVDSVLDVFECSGFQTSKCIG